MKKELASAAAAAALMIMSQSSTAHIASIDGCYDCGVYDTPSLTFHNTSGFDFTNVQITLHAYQGLNNGITQSRALGNIAAGANTQIFWLDGFSGTVAGDLFSYDYDDSLGGGGICVSGAINTGLCNQVGNFNVTFTAMWNGMAVFSQFSPHSNATGGFVGWEGLNPNGDSEDPLYDVHNGTIGGTLAFIDIGTPAPEPASLALVGIALAGLGLSRRRKNGKA